MRPKQVVYWPDFVTRRRRISGFVDSGLLGLNTHTKMFLCPSFVCRPIVNFKKYKEEIAQTHITPNSPFRVHLSFGHST
jgi:hypothetical protein